MNKQSWFPFRSSRLRRRLAKSRWRGPRGGQARFEPLESRALLAITGLPATIGNQSGAPIVLATNGLGPNALTITLQDQIIGGTAWAVATITANTPTGTVTNSYWNFNNSISFTGTFDTAGTVVNSVSVTTPYGFDLSQGTTALDWSTSCNFASRALPNVAVSLTNADSLAVTTTPGSPLTSTVVGTFTSPTLSPGAGAAIALNSNGPVKVLSAGVTTYDFTYTGTKNGTPFSPLLTLQGGLKTSNDITITDSHDISIDQPLQAGGKITITTAGGTPPAGKITVNKTLTAGGAIAVTSAQSLTTNDAIKSTAAGVSLTSGNGSVLTVNEDVTAVNGDLSLLGDGGIVTNAAADILAVTGAMTLRSTAGYVRAAGSLTATANAITINADKLDAQAAAVTAWSGLTVTAGTDARLNGPTTITGVGGVTVTANNDLIFAGPTTLLATGNLKATATEGDLVVLPLAPITVTNGTIDLQAVAGTVDVQAQVIANQSITIQAAQGIVLSNAVDPAAEVRATGPAGNVTITNNANQILVDAPVTSQGGAVSITCTLGDIDVRDDLSALLDVVIKANTAVMVNGIAPNSITVTSQTGTIDASSTTSGVKFGPNLVVVAGPGAAAGVKLTAATVVDLQVPLSTQGDIEITSPDSFVVQQALTSNLGAVTITAANGPVTAALAPITASEAITISGQTTVSIDTTLTSTAAGISLTSTGGSVVVGASAALVATSVTKGTIAINAANAFSMGIALNSGSNLSVTTGATFTPIKDFTSVAGNVTVAVTTGSLNVTGSTITAAPATGSVTLSAAGSLTMDVSKIAVGLASGNLSATAGGGLIITPGSPITVGGSITLSSVSPTVGFAPTAGNDLLAKTGSIALTFGGTIDVRSIDVQAPLGSISLTSTAGDVLVGTKAFVVSPTVGKITLAGLGAAPLGVVTIGQPLVAGSDITITSTQTFTLGFSLTSITGGVAITSNAGNVNVSGATITAPAGAISLSAPSGSVTLGPTAYLTGTGFSAASFNKLVVSAPITAVGGGITLTSTSGDVALSGTANLTALGGTITLIANGEINNGTTNGAVSTTFVKASTLIATAQGSGLPLGALPVFAFTNASNDVDHLEIVLETAGGAAVGAGVTYVDTNSVTVDKLVNNTGVVSLTAGGGLTVNATIGVPGNPSTTLTGITLLGVGPVTVNGGLSTNGPGNIAVTSQSNLVTIAGTVDTANGTITIVSGGGAGLTVGGAITAAGPTGAVTLNSVSAVSVNGSVTSTGAVTVASTLGGVAISGSATAGAASALALTAGLAITVSGPIWAGTNVTLTAGTGWTLGGSLIASTGDVVLTSSGTGVSTITSAVSALLGKILITSPDTIAFDGGSLTAARPTPYVLGGPGTIVLVGKTVTVTTQPVIWGSRLELRTVATSPITLTGNNSVDSLAVSCGGAFTFTNSSPLLEITDFNPAVASVQVSTGGNLTITQSMLGGIGGRFRVVDGISCGGALSLSANQSALGVEFVTTAVTDNPALPPAFAGTLRDMLGYINANTATNGVTNAVMSAVFDEPGSPVAAGGTIGLTAALNPISKRILFDGSLPATPLGGNVTLDGVGVTTTSNALTFATGSGGSTVQELAIGRFKSSGIELRSSDNTVRDVQTWLIDGGGVARGNGVGIRVTGAGAARNFVGTQAVGNRIGNNTGAGVVIQGGATYTTVLGNFIGVEADGTTPAPNGSDGVRIVGGKGNVLGSASSTAGANVIANNAGNGVALLNVFGTTVDYGTCLYNNTITANTLDGVVIQGGRNNQIGAAGAGNTVQGNKGNGIALTAATNGNLITSNAVSGSKLDGVLVDASYANQISANTLSGNTKSGTRIRGVAVAKNQATNLCYSNDVQANGDAQTNGGIVLESSFGQVIGVDAAGTTWGNTVSQNTGSGIVILNGTGTLVPQSNVVVGNAVTKSTYDGIRVQGSLGNIVRGNTANDNGSAGIAVVNAAAANPTDARFSQGNVLTANVAGRNTVGILVQGASTKTMVGGTLVSQGNRVFGSTSHGISLERLSTGVPYATRVQNNVIGLDVGNAVSANQGNGLNLDGASGTAVNFANLIANSLGAGIKIVGGSGNTVGSPVAGRSNQILSNGGDGILITEPPAPLTTLTTVIVISGNRIDGNGGNGIAVSGSRTTNVTIGRAPSITVPTGDENTISNNGGDGIRVSAASNVTMIGNQYTNNVGKPIALAGGANGGIVPPVTLVSKPRTVGGRPQWEVSGTVAGTAGQRFYVDVYDANLTYLGRVLATVGKTGTGNFRAILTGKVGATAPLRATCTLANPGLFGGTSEFTA